MLGWVCGFVFAHPIWSVILVLILVHILRVCFQRSTVDRVLDAKLPNMILPNGLKVYSLNEQEAHVLYFELFEERCYLQKDIAVHDGDVIFDVGANIGMFTLSMLHAHRNLRIFAFEPIPTLHELARRNVDLHVRTATTGSQVQLFNAGLSREPAEHVEFDFDPELSVGAGMCQGQVESAYRKASGKEWNDALIQDGIRIKSCSPAVGKALLYINSLPLGSTLLTGLLALSELQRKRRVQKVSCQLMTVAQVIKANHIDHIDLFKLDVEGAEMAVLEGILPEHFALIRQFVIEVHDIDGRVTKMLAFLRARGYEAVVDKQEWAVHKLMNIFTIYAVRKDKTAPTKSS